MNFSKNIHRAYGMCYIAQKENAAAIKLREKWNRKNRCHIYFPLHCKNNATKTFVYRRRTKLGKIASSLYIGSLNNDKTMDFYE